MRESDVERHLIWAVARVGGATFKFHSPNQRGVSDRIVCLPDGQTWFVELKARGGRLSELQKLFAQQMRDLNQNYACLASTGEIDGWLLSTTRTIQKQPHG